MSHLQYFNYPGAAKEFTGPLRYSHAVRIDNRLELSGQGGWDRDTLKISSDLETEIDQAFDNVDRALKAAGGNGWNQVYKIRIYLAKWESEETLDVIGKSFKKWMPDHCPIYTVVGVTRLGLEEMRIEIEVEAHLGA